MQYKLTIPGRLPGLNELIEAERANRYKGAQLKKDAERRICAEIRRQLHGVHIRRPVVMRYLWVEPDRRRDRDNITAGRKFVQDALVRCKDCKYFGESITKDPKNNEFFCNHGQYGLFALDSTDAYCSYFEPEGPEKDEKWKAKIDAIKA